MTWLPDSALDRLRRVADQPELAGTKYRLIEEIARGGMGTVYLAEDRELRRQVALKVLHDPTSDPEAAERMIREARILAKLEHPGIVPVHDVARLADGRIYYVMKLVRGKRLDEQFDDAAPIPERLRTFERICEAVSFAHAHGVVHRDLKPANIMVGPFGEVLVMDWGVARLLRNAGSPGQQPDVETVSTSTDLAPPALTASDEAETLTRRTAFGTVIGTPDFMSPEQERGDVEQVDERSDVYSLGAVLYSMLTGGAPREGLSPRRVRPEIPRRLDAICRKAMARSRGDRYATVEELRSDVSRQLSGLPVAAYEEGPIERVARVASNYRTPILLVAAYLAMRLILLAI